MEQEKVDELVERFYSHLTRESYFHTMFSERKVDVEKLKERQKVFISSLINGGTPERNRTDVKQVQERHPFSTTPEHAKTWLSLMEKTMDEMQFAAPDKQSLMVKMNHLMDSMMKK
ncbi:MAG TPA: hypothetical protein VFK33_13165 [Bacillales bacterium]|nr:hypothetical protein [Bacillales bacterium]